MDACRTHETPWKRQGTLNYWQNYQNQNKAFYKQFYELQNQYQGNMMEFGYVKEKIVLDRLNRQCRLYSRWLQNRYKVCSRHDLHKEARKFLLCHPSWGARITMCPIPRRDVTEKSKSTAIREDWTQFHWKKGTRVLKCYSRLKSTTRHYPRGGKMMRSSVLVNWHIYKSAFYPSTETGDLEVSAFWWFHFKRTRS